MRVGKPTRNQSSSSVAHHRVYIYSPLLCSRNTVLALARRSANIHDPLFSHPVTPFSFYRVCCTELHHDRLTVHRAVIPAGHILAPARRPAETPDIPRARRSLYAHLPPSTQRWAASAGVRRPREDENARDYARGSLACTDNNIHVSCIRCVCTSILWSLCRFQRAFCHL